MEKIPSLEVFMYTMRMWAIYHRFNWLQQMSHPHTSILHNERYQILINRQSHKYINTIFDTKFLTKLIH